MKLLLTITPTVLLIVYGQLITKWRVMHLQQKFDLESTGLARVLEYVLDPVIISAYLASFLGSITWIFVVEKYDISSAFPIYIGLTVMIVMLGGVLLLKEPLSYTKVLAVILIILGVLVGAKS